MMNVKNTLYAIRYNIIFPSTQFISSFHEIGEFKYLCKIILKLKLSVCGHVHIMWLSNWPIHIKVS